MHDVGTAISYSIGGILGAAFVAYGGSTFAEASLAIVIGSLVMIVLNRAGL